MCGIAGSYARQGASRRRSAAPGDGGRTRHRGPDGTGLYLDGRFGMVNTRLAIVDLEGGDQPLSSRVRPLLGDAERRDLQPRRASRRARARSATASRPTPTPRSSRTRTRNGESACLDRLNGDFAIARLGSRDARRCCWRAIVSGSGRCSWPSSGGDLCFASEAKALLRHPAAQARGRPRRGRRHVHAVGDAARPLGARRHPRAAAGPRADRRRGRRPARSERWWDIDFAPEPAPAEQLVDELRRPAGRRDAACACAPTFRSRRT